MNDITHRLRCKYAVGPIIDGEPEFGWRDYSGPPPMPLMLPTPLMLEAAKEIEKLRDLLNAYRKKRAVDGLNGRPWDGSAHLEAETAVAALESA